MGNHREPFRSLGPIDWADVPQDDLGPFLHDIFSGAHTVIDSIPSSTSASSIKPRARANTDSARPDGAVFAAADPSHDDPEAAEQARKLQQEWKEVKVNPRENPLGIRVYKLASKDGGGAWFARRSVHEGLTFEQWKAGLDREFVESMAVQGGPGSGSIRGIGADKRVEDHVVPDAGNVQGIHSPPWISREDENIEHPLRADFVGSIPAICPVPWADITQRLCHALPHIRLPQHCV